ncbi:MAG: TetR/AcrR family transcriptional regulator [Saprospiraceae bacterium]|nr:TetR/AcrR family transcriptional regulator [Saprospiraceae bacterium]
MEAAYYRKIADMFMRFGIKSVSMDDISRSLGISKKTLYLFTASKQDLVGKILDNYLLEEKEQISAIKDKASDSIHELLLIANHVTEMLKKLSANTLYDLRKYYGEHWTKMESERHAMIYEDIKRNLDRGIEQGLYREDVDTDLLSTLYVRMATFIMDEKIVLKGSDKKVQLYREFIRYHIRGIATSKGIRLMNKYDHLLKN